MSAKQGGEGHVIRFEGPGWVGEGRSNLRRTEGARLDGDDQCDGHGGGIRSGGGLDRTW